MDERLKAFSRKAAEIAADPSRDSPPVAQRHIDRFNEVKELIEKGGWTIQLENEWMFMIQFDGHPSDDFSAACYLTYPNGDDCWSKHGIASTEECREAALELVGRADRDGFKAPSQIEIVTAIPDGCVERAVAILRQARSQ